MSAGATNVAETGLVPSAVNAILATWKTFISDLAFRYRMNTLKNWPSKSLDRHAVAASRYAAEGSSTIDASGFPLGW